MDASVSRLTAGASVFVLLAAVAGCGGARASGDGSAASTPSAREDRDSRDPGGSPLDPRRLVAGTGVSLRAPRGSEPTPFGAGFVHRARRIQMLVAAAQGSEQVLDAFRRGVDNEADVVATESVRISAREAILHIDRQETGEELEI